MLSREQKFILYAIRKSMGLPAVQVDDSNLDQDYIANVVLKNGILATVFQFLPTEIQASLNSSYLSRISQSTQQNYEGEIVINAIRNAGLECIALKGWEMRKLYPHPYMREMADLDVLIRPYSFEVVKEILTKLGFQTEGESFWRHDVFHKNNVTIETHKRLTDDSNIVKDWEAYMWSRAIRDGQTCRMTNEDYYTFHFIHLYKDFCNGSLGLRRVIDTWLLNKQITKCDPTTEKILRDLGIWQFHNRMLFLASVCMNETEMDSDSELLLMHSFEYGIFGSEKAYKIGRIVRLSGDRGLTTGKILSILKALFLPYNRMKAQFPILQKYPFLLPLFWTKRISKYIAGGNASWSKKKLDYKTLTSEDYAEMKSFFKAGGMQFENEKWMH